MNPLELGQRTAWLNMAAKIVGAGLSFILLLVLARTMTPEAFADIAVILVWLALATALVSFSMPLVVVRFVAENLAAGRFGLAQGVFRYSIVATTGVSLLISCLGAAPLLFGWITLPRDLSTSTLVAALLLPPGVMLLVLAGLLQGLKKVVAAELFINTLRPVLMLAGIGWIWLTHQTSISAPMALMTYLATTVVILITSLVYVYIASPTQLIHAKPSYDRRAWRRSAMGFMAVMLTAAVNERIDLLVIGLVAPPTEVASFVVAARFSQTVIVAVSGVFAVMAPHLVVQLVELRAGRFDEVQGLVRNTARTALYITLLALLGFGLLGPLLLSLFGPHYQSAYAPLLILAVGQVISALFGPAAVVATFAGETRIAVISLVASVVVNVVLNITLTPVLGAVGTALATATATISAASIAWALMRRYLMLDTFVIASRLKRAV